MITINAAKNLNPFKLGKYVTGVFSLLIEYAL